MVGVDVHVSSHLKKELGCIWAVDKRLWVITRVHNIYTERESVQRSICSVQTHCVK